MSMRILQDVLLRRPIYRIKHLISMMCVEEMYCGMILILVLILMMLVDMYCDMDLILIQILTRQESIHRNSPG